MSYYVKVFKLNPFDWWAGYDLASVKSAYLAESGMAEEESSDEEEEVPEDAMKTVRLYPNPYADESSTFQEELNRMVDEGQKFPCSFAGRYTTGSTSSHSAVTMEDRI
jgi:hypothetical protein